jgi:hypothetical protein
MTDAHFDAITLIDAWADGDSAHLRLDRLLRAMASDDALGAETLGQRNQRLLRFARRLGGGPLEGVVRCPACASDNEFAVPEDALLALPPPTVTTATVAGVTLRLPRMAELLAHDATPLLARFADGALSAEAAQAAGAAFDALDPAAHVVLEIACADCNTGFPVDVDIAAFVAMRVDRAVAGLMREIDIIAGAYGWSEAEIAALPPHRRRAYVAMIGQRRAPTQEATA